jgi:HTH-type transcriptional regulator/antitoxin HigA
MTAEQKSPADLLTVLIERFEHRYEIGHADPLDALHALREERGLRQGDLIEVFGSSSVTSDVVNGKREISKQHAQKPAEFFHVPVSLFI